MVSTWLWHHVCGGAKFPGCIHDHQQDKIFGLRDLKFKLNLPLILVGKRFHICQSKLFCLVLGDEQAMTIFHTKWRANKQLDEGWAHCQFSRLISHLKCAGLGRKNLMLWLYVLAKDLYLNLLIFSFDSGCSLKVSETFSAIWFQIDVCKVGHSSVVLRVITPLIVVITPVPHL